MSLLLLNLLVQWQTVHVIGDYPLHLEQSWGKSDFWEKHYNVLNIWREWRPPYYEELVQSKKSSPTDKISAWQQFSAVIETMILENPREGLDVSTKSFFCLITQHEFIVGVDMCFASLMPSSSFCVSWTSQLFLVACTTWDFVSVINCFKKCQIARDQ